MEAPRDSHMEAPYSGSHGSPVKAPWKPRGSSVATPWKVRGSPIETLRKKVEIGWGYNGNPLEHYGHITYNSIESHGSPMEAPWEPHGSPTGVPWENHGEKSHGSRMEDPRDTII